jgi:hypothetical protein
MRCCPTTARTTTSTIRHHAAQSCTWCPQVTSNLFYSPGSTPRCECGRKAGHKKESRKGAFDHHDTLETWMLGAVMMGLFCTFFDSNSSSHNSQGVDWLLWHSKLMTLYAVSYKIKYTVTGLSCVCSKIQQLCLIHYALDLRWYLLRRTPHCMVLASSINFIEDYWYMFGSCKIKATHDY